MEALRRLLRRLLPASLFGRLALLVSAAVLASHVLALTVVFRMRPPPPGGMDPASSPPAMLRLTGNKQLIEFDKPAPPPGPPPEHRKVPGLWLDIGVRLAALLAAAWVAARWLSAPIRRLACAAKALGQDIDHPPLPEEGPREYRDASRLFNQMRTQIRQQLSDSDRLVAAVSHDLRTPLTRLRLRVESLCDTAQKRAFEHDIVEMDQMLTATLDYMRGAALEEQPLRLDVLSLVQSLADDQLDYGHHVRVGGTAAPLWVQASGLRRCLANLLENAVRYGGSAYIQLLDGPDQLCIEIRDAGPGLPETELRRVMEPFYRVEAMRDQHPRGVGLGLSIAADVARRHGGSLVLRNGEAGGLVAALRLPRLPVQPA